MGVGMTQVLIDRATLEQLVAALNEVDQHVDLKRYDTAPNEVLFDVVMAALTAGSEALANAEPEEVHPLETHCPHGAPVEDYCKLCDMEVSEQFKDTL